MNEETFGVRSAFGWCIFDAPPAKSSPPPPIRRSGTRDEAEKLRDAMVARHPHVEYVIEPHKG